jgi:hypothetical protein
MQHTFGEDSIKVIQGASLDLKILIKDYDGDPFDLEGVESARIIFPGRPSNIIGTLAAEEIEILEPTAKGALAISLSPAKTKLIQKDDRQSFEIELIKEGKTYVVMFQDMLDVVSRLG